MGPKKARKNVRKLEVPTDTPTMFELADTAADIKRRREEREQRERKESEKQEMKEKTREEAWRVKTPQDEWRRQWLKKRPRNENEIDTDGGGEANSSI